MEENRTDLFCALQGSRSFLCPGAQKRSKTSSDHEEGPSSSCGQGRLAESALVRERKHLSQEQNAKRTSEVGASGSAAVGCDRGVERTARVGEPHIKSPTGTLEATIIPWGPGKPIFRVHPDAYGSAQFNPAATGNARFSPLANPGSAIVEVLTLAQRLDVLLTP